VFYKVTQPDEAGCGRQLWQLTDMLSAVASQGYFITIKIIAASISKFSDALQIICTR